MKAVSRACRPPRPNHPQAPGVGRRKGQGGAARCITARRVAGLQARGCSEKALECTQRQGVGCGVRGPRPTTCSALGSSGARGSTYSSLPQRMGQYCTNSDQAASSPRTTTAADTSKREIHCVCMDDVRVHACVCVHSSSWPPVACSCITANPRFDFGFPAQQHQLASCSLQLHRISPDAAAYVAAAR